MIIGLPCRVRDSSLCIDLRRVLRSTQALEWNLGPGVQDVDVRSPKIVCGIPCQGQELLVVGAHMG